jgi:hypothetical protein
MIEKYIISALLIALQLMSYFSYAQNSEKISLSTQKQITNELSRLIKLEYVLENIGIKMATHLDSLNNHVLTEEMDSEKFITLLNTELMSICNDKHLGVVNPTRFKEFQKMFGSDDENHHKPKRESHSQPNQQSNHKSSENHHAGEAHAEASENELAGSRVINRDGRTNIGLLKIDRFDGTDSGLNNMQKLLTSFVGVDAIIIDLRNCKGGDADMVKALSGYFFGTSTYLVSTIGRKDENGKREVSERVSIVNELSKEFKNTQLYIMTSKNTFSAAESFAFGLKLNERATLIGGNTGGGGHMNDFFPLPAGYGVSISVGRTFDGKTGEGFQGSGVAADVEIEADHAFAKTLELIEQARTAQLAYEVSKEKVYQTLQQLSEAWYTGNVKSAESILYHKYKAHLSTNDTSVESEVDLLKLIEAGSGSKTPREVRNREISIYEVRNNETAIARIMLRDQIHYLHLINDNGTWKILSDLITKKQMHG